MPKRVDSNQPEIVQALRDIGATVQHLHEAGKGCPDILVGYHGYNWLFEIKDGDKPPSKRKLTADEKEWHATWRGQVSVIKSADEAIWYVTGYNSPGHVPPF